METYLGGDAGTEGKAMYLYSGYALPAHRVCAL